MPNCIFLAAYRQRVVLVFKLLIPQHLVECQRGKLTKVKMADGLEQTVDLTDTEK